jgi:hypothetical protein
MARDSCSSQRGIKLVDRRRSVLKTTAGELDATASNGAVGARSTGSDRLRNGSAVAADAELVGTEANNSTVGGARLGPGDSWGSSGWGGSWSGSGNKGLNLISKCLLTSFFATSRDTRITYRSRRGSRRRSRRRSIAASGRSAGAARGSTKLTVAGSELGQSITTAARESGTWGSAARLANRRSSVGERKVLALGGTTSGVGQVGDEHVGKTAEDTADISASTTDLERRAVHVHLTVTELVEPGPREAVLAGRKIFRKRDRDAGKASSVLGIGGKVARGLGRASTDLGEENLPLGVLGRCKARRDGKLAGSTAVDCRALEFDVLGVTRIPLVHGANSEVALAREVVDLDGRVVGVTEGDRVAHDNVGRGAGSEGEDSRGIHFVDIADVLWSKLMLLWLKRSQSPAKRYVDV